MDGVTYKNQKFILCNFGGWEVQNNGAGRFLIPVEGQLDG